MSPYSIDITDESADSLVRDIIKDSIRMLISMEDEDDREPWLSSLVITYNYYSPPDEYFKLEDFKNDV